MNVPILVGITRGRRTTKTTRSSLVFCQGEALVELCSIQEENYDATHEELDLVISINTLHHDLRRFFAERIAAAGSVARVYMSFFEKEIDIWTIVENDSKEERNRLYEIEGDILRRFKEFSFDFHIFLLEDVNLDEFEKDPGVVRIHPFPL